MVKENFVLSSKVSIYFDRDCKSHFSMHSDVSFSCCKAKDFNSSIGFFPNGTVVSDTENMIKHGTIIQTAITCNKIPL